MRDHTTHYGPVSKCLHWCIAGLVLALFGLGLWMVQLDYYHTWYHQGPALHISGGLLLLLLTLLQLAWRQATPAPTPLASHPHWMQRMALWVKRTLHLLLLALLLTGYLMTTAEGQAARFFDWPLIPSIAKLDGAAVDWLGSLHLWGAWLLIALVAGHAGAALFHHFVHKDATLRRILPFGQLHSDPKHDPKHSSNNSIQKRKAP